MELKLKPGLEGHEGRGVGLGPLECPFLVERVAEDSGYIPVHFSVGEAVWTQVPELQSCVSLWPSTDSALNPSVPT